MWWLELVCDTTYSSPQTPWLDLRGLLLRGGSGRRGNPIIKWSGGEWIEKGTGRIWKKVGRCNLKKPLAKAITLTLTMHKQHAA